MQISPKIRKKVRDGVWTHEILVDVAESYLNYKRCDKVFTEVSSGLVTGEQPDAIGFIGTSSILIECKASHSDYLADKRKHFRRNPSLGVGESRYYLCVHGTIGTHELPDGWGLICVMEESGMLSVRYQSEVFESNLYAERTILVRS